MKKFRFRLERVLQYRQVVKREKQRDLIKQQAILAEQLELLAQMEHELSIAELGDGQIILAQDVKLLGDYAGRLRSGIASKRLEIEECEALVEAARLVYQQAAQEAEALEKLKARKSEAHQVYVAKEEEKFLDEMTVMRSGGKVDEGM